MSRYLVVYHGPACPDGFCAAWVAYRRFGDAADYVPMEAGADPPQADYSGRNVYFLDVCPKRPLLDEVAARAQGVVVLDHHENAAEDLAGLPCPNLGGECWQEGALSARFDENKSGARLAWEHFFPLDTKGCWLVDFVEDRDLWRWKHDHSREVSAALSSAPKDFKCWDSFYARGLKPDGFRAIVGEGHAVLRYQEGQVDFLCSLAREIVLDGHKVRAVNTPVLQSEVAQKLAIGRPFGVCWYVDASGRTRYSLRSVEGGENVTRVAKKHGGGGHPSGRAAGYVEVPP